MSSDFKVWINSIREKINLRIYDSKNNVITGLRIGSGIVATITIVALIYYHGFKLTADHKEIVGLIVRGSIAFYLFKYFVQFFFSFSPIQYLKDSKWEGFLMLFLVLNILSINIFKIELVSTLGHSIGIEGLSDYFLIFIQVYFLLIVALEVGKASFFLPRAKLTPPTILLLSFLMLIAAGTGLLMLPEMTAAGTSMRFIDAIFTSISASCVTGLIVVDTATYFSFKGQLIIMLLVQLGGLNILSFATLFSFFTKQGIGISQQKLVMDNFTGETLNTSRDLLKRIFRYTLFFEGIGFILIYFSWSGLVEFRSFGERLFFSLFHSISAFNNAGFSLYGQGLATDAITNARFLQICIILLVFFGGLGFNTIRDLFTIKVLKERYEKPWLHLRVGTKISVYSAVALVALGFITYLIFERNHALQGLGAVDRVIHAMFESVVTRTAGFNTSNTASLTMPVLIVMMVLMFIGGGSGSTAGGIKTSTFTLVFLSAWATIRGSRKIEIFKNTIPWDLLNRAYSIFLFTLSSIVIGFFILSITDPQIPMRDILFEEISAFCTVGKSTGITAQLSIPGRIVLMVSMVIGRIGTLTLAFSLRPKKLASNRYKYPDARMMVG